MEPFLFVLPDSHGLLHDLHNAYIVTYDAKILVLNFGDMTVMEDGLGRF